MTDKSRRHDWRPSRDERAPYLTALNEALAQARIDADEHEDRLARAEAATSFHDLDGLVADIPFEWQDRQRQRVRRAGRRRFILGAAGLFGVAAASWAGTRAWVTGGQDAEANGRQDHRGGSLAEEAGSQAEEAGSEAEEAGSEAVPTDLVQVENWRRDTVSTAVDHAVSVGLTMISRISGGGDDFMVKGSDSNQRWLSVQFRKNARPKVEFDDNWELSSKWISPDELPDIDVSALYREVKSDLDANSSTHRLDIGYETRAQQWLITISDRSTSSSWTLDGRTA